MKNVSNNILFIVLPGPLSNYGNIWLIYNSNLLINWYKTRAVAQYNKAVATTCNNRQLSLMVYDRKCCSWFIYSPYHKIVCIFNLLFKFIIPLIIYNNREQYLVFKFWKFNKISVKYLLSPSHISRQEVRVTDSRLLTYASLSLTRILQKHITISLSQVVTSYLTFDPHVIVDAFPLYLITLCMSLFHSYRLWHIGWLLTRASRHVLSLFRT